MLPEGVPSVYVRSIKGQSLRQSAAAGRVADAVVAKSCEAGRRGGRTGRAIQALAHPTMMHARARARRSICDETLRGLKAGLTLQWRIIKCQTAADRVADNLGALGPSEEGPYCDACWNVAWRSGGV